MRAEEGSSLIVRATVLAVGLFGTEACPTSGTSVAETTKEFDGWLVSTEAQRPMQSFAIDRYDAPLVFPGTGKREEEPGL